MQPEKETVTLDEGKENVVIIGRSKDEAGMKKVEKTKVTTHNPDTLRYIEQKMRDKGVQRMDRHPIDGIGLHKNPKSGHGGRCPCDLVDDELSMGRDVPTNIDEGDPNYVDEEIEEKIMRGDSDVVNAYMKGFVVSEVDVAKTANDAHGGISRVMYNLNLMFEWWLCIFVSLAYY
ncbi:hypothetical protein MKX01_021580 [Papaver californicum]|nr:hypothetical protein MKX01_021580 [Papaver californicum]